MIGLFCYGFRTDIEMADAIGLEDQCLRDRFTHFVRYVLRSRNRIVVECLRWGLPADFPANLPDSVTLRCKTCRAKLTSVPCATCGRRPLLDQRPEYPGRVRMGRPLREPAESTDATPGSMEKIIVMRERIERGESCFHPGDVFGCRRKIGDTMSQSFGESEEEDGDSLDFPGAGVPFSDTVSLPTLRAA